jgi:hypothetical protein
MTPYQEHLKQMGISMPDYEGQKFGDYQIVKQQDLDVAFLRNEVFSLRQEVSKLKEEIAEMKKTKPRTGDICTSKQIQGGHDDKSYHFKVEDKVTLVTPNSIIKQSNGVIKKIANNHWDINNPNNPNNYTIGVLWEGIDWDGSMAGLWWYPPQHLKLVEEEKKFHHSEPVQLTEEGDAILDKMFMDNAKPKKDPNSPFEE